MTNPEYRTAIRHVIYLAGCAVNGNKPDVHKLTDMDPEEVYKAASFHHLSAVVGMALENTGLQTPEFHKAVARSRMICLQFDHHRTAVLAELERAGIWYMPLKGVILKEYYPGFGMREMGDNDILFDADRAKDVRQIMTGLGFETESYNAGNDDVYFKPPFNLFEMHRSLFIYLENTEAVSYYVHIKDRLLKDPDNQYGYHFSDEDFYIYMIVHEYKHYSQSGTGLRSLLDTYVYLKNRQPDRKYISRELKKLGLSEFEKTNRELALRLFTGQQLNTEHQKMLDQIISDGSYGSLDAGIDRQISGKGKLRYFISRLTAPREIMLVDFPILKKLPFLYPFFWIIRLFRGLFFRPEKAFVEIQSLLKRRDR